MIDMVALQSFAGLEGRVRRGTRLRVSEHRAAFLTERGLAAPVGDARPPVGPTRTQDVTPERTNAPAPAPQLEAVGGGWYEVAGVRYRGKANAEAALREAQGDDRSPDAT